MSTERASPGRSEVVTGGAIDRAPTTIEVRVRPWSWRAVVVDVADGVVRARVTTGADRVAANDEVRSLIAGVLSIDRRSVRVIGGVGSLVKTVAVDGVEPTEVERCLSALSVAGAAVSPAQLPILHHRAK